MFYKVSGQDALIEASSREEATKKALEKGLYQPLVSFAGYSRSDYTDSATQLGWSDRYAFSIIKRTEKTIVVQRDIAELVPSFKPEFIPGGFAGHCINQHEQDYTYRANPSGVTYPLRWSEKKLCYVYKGLEFIPGRREFNDYNF